MRRYDDIFKKESIKLGEEIGVTKASKELGIPQSTLETWKNKHKKGTLNLDILKPKTALNLAEENKELKRRIKELERTNEILSKATVFFAQSQKK